MGSGDLRKLLDRFHLDRIDSGDLLLLGLLFLLYREGADEELLFALVLFVYSTVCRTVPSGRVKSAVVTAGLSSGRSAAR